MAHSRVISITNLIGVVKKRNRWSLRLNFSTSFCLMLTIIKKKTPSPR